MPLTARWASYRLFPYERMLAERELLSLTGAVPYADESGALIVDSTQLRSPIERSTYFTGITDHQGGFTKTEQTLVEELHLHLREAGNRSRQATRYGLHGIHEYKGKFNPQVVRALCNVVDPDATMLVDPFCGSGTSLIEAMRLGLDAHGVDQSPIAYYIASAKARATASRSHGVLRRRLADLAADVAQMMKAAQEEDRPAALSGILPPGSIDYLKQWFTPPAYAAVSSALHALEQPRGTTHGMLARLALSSILRRNSLQLPEDLRIRRRPEPFCAPPLWEDFQSAVASIDLGLEEMTSWNMETIGQVHVVLGSSADPRTIARTATAKRRLFLMSPPYATALPYIDTDRLSLVALGLVRSDQILALERNLLGSREWNRRTEVEWNERFHQNVDSLPSSVLTLLGEIMERNLGSGAGFRRRAVPALLYRYFTGMASSFDAWKTVLKQGEKIILIVGHNRTTADGKTMDVTTPQLLGEVASTRGLRLDEILPLETWPRYGLHSQNGVAGEEAIVLSMP